MLHRFHPKPPRHLQLEEIVSPGISFAPAVYNKGAAEPGGLTGRATRFLT